jgi:putative Mg2+ transporter-C (MgtC) family protein
VSGWDVADVLRLDLLAKLLLAVILGGAIGMDREVKRKPAGLRTNILICLGATLLTDVSVRMAIGPDGARVGDPARLAAQIVSGVGFLGAGTIMQGGGIVTGLTSAATIWVVAAIGIAIGAGHFLEAAGAGALVTVVLAGMGRAEHVMRRWRRTVNLTIRTRPGTTVETVRDALQAEGIRIVTYDVYEHAHDRTFEVRLSGPAVQFDSLAQALLDHPDVTGVHGG